MEIRLTESGKGEYRKKGADTWIPFSAGELYYLGRYGESASVNIDVTKYAQYKELTVQNFIGYSFVKHCKYVNSGTHGTYESNHATASTALSYNPATGILTFTSPINHTTGSNNDFSRVNHLLTDLYLYTGSIKPL